MLRSLWLDDDGNRQFARAALAAAPAVEIVGAGVTGLSCALTLAEAGVSVCVHDARGVAGGASGQNAGFALRGAAIAYDEARTVLGPVAARQLWALSEVALVRLGTLAGDAFRPEGSLRLAVDDAERERIRAEYEALVADGFAAEWREPPVGGCGGRFHGVLFHPTDGAIQPLRWIRRLAAAALAAGADIVEGSRVGQVAELGAQHVVVASDGYGSKLLVGLDAVIVPARG